jgi:hypothetical protein
MVSDNPAAVWITTQLAKGTTLKAKGKRLEMLPKRSYSELSDAELLTLRHHRAAIVALVHEQHGGMAIPATSFQVDSWSTRNTAPPFGGVSSQPPNPTHCPYCHAPFASCIAIRQDSRWLTEHLDRPDVAAHLEVQRQARLAWLGSDRAHRDGAPATPSPEPDAFAEMLEALRRQRRR